MKKVILCLLTILLLTACENNIEYQAEQEKELKVVGTFNEVKVIEKRKEGGGRATPTEYFITIQKGDQKLELKALGEDAYRILQKGNVITIGYTKDYYIKQIQFPELEEKPNE